jgi:sulfate permease, SulP family
MKPELSFRPRLLDTLKGYGSRDFGRDLTAGLTVGIVALPLAMALGIASLEGQPNAPAVGIYTAIIAGFLISALGGSKVQIGGPTAAFIPVIVIVVQQYGFPNLILCTLIAGIMLVAMGAARLGTLIKFIPLPVTAGFTAGIAVVIFSTQIKDFFGLHITEKMPGEFIERLGVLAHHAGSFDWPSVLLAAATVALIKFWPKSWGRRVPASIAVVVGGTLAVTLLNLQVDTIGSRFGEAAIPQGLPAFQLPQVDWANLIKLIDPAFTIAALAAIESLLSAVVADGMIGDRHDSNQELMGQGLANIASAFFGGLPATGAIARTATNIRSGGHTPVAGMIHALALLGIILAAAPLARFIPLPILAGVLVNVAINMGEWHNFARLKRWPRSDAAVFLVTFALTVVMDITRAVQWGMLLAAMIFIHRITQTTKIVGATEGPAFDEDESQQVGDKSVPKGVMIYSVFGAFLFGAADKLETALRRSYQEPDVLILKMRQVLAMDATGLEALEGLARQLRSRGKHLLLCGPHSQPLFAMDRHGFIDWLGRENVCADMEESLARARQLLGDKGGSHS